MKVINYDNISLHINVFNYYNTNYTIFETVAVGCGSAFALALDAARPERATLKLAPGVNAIVSVE